MLVHSYFKPRILHYDNRRSTFRSVGYGQKIHLMPLNKATAYNYIHYFSTLRVNDDDGHVTNLFGI